jgi:hypothetical protein
MTVVSSAADKEQMIAAAPSIKAMDAPIIKPLKRGLTTNVGGSCHRRWTAHVSNARLAGFGSAI